MTQRSAGAVAFAAFAGEYAEAQVRSQPPRTVITVASTSIRRIPPSVL